MLEVNKQKEYVKMVKMYNVLKKYICAITGELCEAGGENNDCHSPPPNCDDCEIYLTRNNPIIEEKTYTHFRIKNGIEYAVE